MTGINWKPNAGGPVSFAPVDLTAMRARIVANIVAEEGEPESASAAAAIQVRATTQINQWLDEKRAAIEAMIRASEATP